MANKYLDLLKKVLAPDYVPALHLVKCPRCRGTGNEPEGLSSEWIACQACNGKGKVLMKESEFKIWEEK